MDGEASYEWLDITADFFYAVQCLQLGQLCHDEHFGLYEAMSAIEMMDPKMDAGVMTKNIEILDFDSAVASGQLKLCDVPLNECIGIIDTTMACLVTWLEGHSLAQTVLTNLYVHRPFEVTDTCMKAFSIATLRLCDEIRDIIMHAQVYEEEDFQVMTYNFNMARKVTNARAIGMLKEVEDEYLSMMRGMKNKGAQSSDDGSTSPSYEDVNAVYCRIKLLRLTFQFCVALTSKQSAELYVEELRKILSLCDELLPVILSTIDRGVQPVACEAAHQGVRMVAFEPLVNQRLLPPTFPRYTKIKCRQESVEYLRKLVETLQEMLQIKKLTTLHDIIKFVSEISKRSPAVFPQSILQLLALPQKGSKLFFSSMQESLRESVKVFIRPPCFTSKSCLNNAEAKECVENFLASAVLPFTELIQIYGNNRARQRDKLAHVLQKLGSLQEEADRVDAFLHTLTNQPPEQQHAAAVGPRSGYQARNHIACFSTWCLYYILHVMAQYLLSGFELELYARHEFQYIFWYLHDLLYNWLLSALQRADTYLHEHDTYLEQQHAAAHDTQGGQGGGHRGKKKGSSRKRNKKQEPAAARVHSHEFLYIQAMQHLTGGFYKAMRGFSQSGKIRLPEARYDSEQIRYEHRMAPFINIATPPYVYYFQYVNTTTRNAASISPESIFLTASKHFGEARKLFESLPNPNKEAQNLILISKTNFVVMKLLAGGHRKGEAKPPDFDFSLHCTFPVIKI